MVLLRRMFCILSSVQWGSIISSLSDLLLAMINLSHAPNAPKRGVHCSLLYFHFLCFYCITSNNNRHKKRHNYSKRIIYLFHVSASHTSRSVGSPARAVSSSQPVSVTSMVCSNWADLDPSMVTAVHPERQNEKDYIELDYIRLSGIRKG